MPFELFDRQRLEVLPLGERVHDIGLDVMLSKDALSDFSHTSITELAKRVKLAKEKRAAVLMMMGAHVIRSGAAPLLIELMERGLVTHFALNGAGAIHDFELAMIGNTCESVAKYVSEGQFGIWRETGLINDAAKEAHKDSIGFGEALGRMIERECFAHRDVSLLAAGYRNRVPVTVHVGIGCDIVHELPNCDGAALGASSYTDFLIYAKTIENLEHGVFLNFGSAVTGPEVYLKCLAMARNVARQNGSKITDFTTAVFDLLPLENESIHDAPPKTDPRYYFRPWKTILARTVADGGESFYVQGAHRDTVSALYRELAD